MTPANTGGGVVETGRRHSVRGASDGGRAGRGRTSGSCSFVFQHGMFCVEFRVLVHHASISGVCVCAVRGVRGACGVRVGCVW